MLVGADGCFVGLSVDALFAGLVALWFAGCCCGVVWD